MAGIEPASESLSRRTSTGVVGLLSLTRPGRGRRVSGGASHLGPKALLIRNPRPVAGHLGDHVRPGSARRGGRPGAPLDGAGSAHRQLTLRAAEPRSLCGWHLAVALI